MESSLSLALPLRLSATFLSFTSFPRVSAVSSDACPVLLSPRGMHSAAFCQPKACAFFLSGHLPSPLCLHNFFYPQADRQTDEVDRQIERERQTDTRRRKWRASGGLSAVSSVFCSFFQQLGAGTKKKRSRLMSRVSRKETERDQATVMLFREEERTLPA